LGVVDDVTYQIAHVDFLFHGDYITAFEAR